MGAKPGTKYKKFPKEHRDETADHVISTGRPAREVARELGIAGSTLGDRVKRRRRELSGGGPAAAPGARRTRGRQEEGRGAREGERLLKVRQKAPVSLTVRNAFRARHRRAPKGVSASSCARKGRPRPRPGRAPARP